MTGDVKRSYVSPLRSAAAAATRQRILSAAKSVFEARGWAGTTMALIAAEAEVSPKTIQAQFGTKARLLADTVDFAIRGDPGSEPIVRKGAAQSIKDSSDARGALALHAAMSTGINSRAAQLAAVVEAGAASDPAVAPLWERMRENMQFGVHWAAELMLSKPGLRPDLALQEVETVLQLAMAWSTYRTLSSIRGMSEAQIESWLGRYYERMLLPAV